MSKRVSLYEAKTNLSALVEEAAAGEEIVITKHGKAKARLLKIEPEAKRAEPRKLGVWKGLAGLPPGGEIPELPEDILAMMLGEDDSEDEFEPPAR